MYSLTRQKYSRLIGACVTLEKLKARLFSLPICSMETIVDVMKRIRLVLFELIYWNKSGPFRDLLAALDLNSVSRFNN